jgi:hypothetical protein
MNEIKIIWDDEEEEFKVLNSELMKEGVKYNYFCDESNEGFVFERKGEVVSYDVGYEEGGEWI